MSRRMAAGETTELSLLAARRSDASGRPAAAVRFDQPFRVDVSYRVNDSLQNAAIVASFMDVAGNLIFESWDTDSSGMDVGLVRRVRISRRASSRKLS